MKTPDKTILNVKLDKSLKREAQALADDLGLPLSTVVIAQLKDFVRSRSVTIAALPRLKAEIEAELGEAIKDYQAGRNISPTLEDPEAVGDYLAAL